MRVTWLALEWPREGQHSGGVGRYVERLAKEMIGRVSLTVVAREGARPLNGVTMVTLPPSRGRLESYYIDPVRAARQVKATHPELVHSHGDDWALGNSWPKVRSFYGTAWGEARSSSGLRALNHAVLAVTELAAAARSDLRLAIAPESAKMFRTHYVVPPVPVALPAVARKPASEPMVLFVGGYATRKRGFMAQAVVEAVRRRTGVHVTLSVVGPESDRVHWAPWVDFHAGLDDAQVDELRRAAWVLISPSKYEGFGIPAFEALAAGVPVITTRNPGSDFISGGTLPDSAYRVCETQAELELALDARVRRGPYLTDDAAELVRSRVMALTELGSSERLLELYEATLVGRALRLS